MYLSLKIIQNRHHEMELDPYICGICGPGSSIATLRFLWTKDKKTKARNDKSAKRQKKVFHIVISRQFCALEIFVDKTQIYF